MLCSVSRKLTDRVIVLKLDVSGVFDPRPPLTIEEVASNARELELCQSEINVFTSWHEEAIGTSRRPRRELGAGDTAQQLRVMRQFIDLHVKWRNTACYKQLATEINQVCLSCALP